jgi:hypothetical protein
LRRQQVCRKKKIGEQNNKSRACAMVGKDGAKRFSRETASRRAPFSADHDSPVTILLKMAFLFFYFGLSLKYR